MPPGQTLDEEARLEERERPGWEIRSSMQNPVALGAKRSADTVKGGIARAPGLLVRTVKDPKKEQECSDDRSGS